MSRQARITRTAISPRLAIRIFLNMRYKAKRYGDKKKQRGQTLQSLRSCTPSIRRPQIPLMRPGSQESPSACFRRCHFEPPQQRSIELDKEPQKGCQAKQSSLRGNLQEIVVKVTVIERVDCADRCNTSGNSSSMRSGPTPNRGWSLIISRSDRQIGCSRIVCRQTLIQAHRDPTIDEG